MGDKKIETRIMEAFRHAFEAFPDGEVEPLPKMREPPDFLVHMKRGTLAIELTELYHHCPNVKRSYQAEENYRRKALERAKMLYDAAGGPPAVINVHFNKQHPIGKRDVEQVARQIVDQIPNDLSGHEQFHVAEDDENYETWPQSLNGISGLLLSRMRESKWGTTDAGFVPTLDKGMVQDRIRRKNAKILDYKEPCDEKWLVIVLSGFELSTAFLLPGDITTTPFDADFDKVFLFQGFEGKARELLLTKP